MKVSITSGKAEGPTKLNAFDNALLDAGIGDINLIKVSSIIPADAEMVNLPQFPAGKMVNTVLSYVSSDQEGDDLCAVIAMALSDDLGCVVEHSGVNKNPDEVKEEAVDMVKYMMRIRGKKINDLIIESQQHRVKILGAAVAAVVYLE
ncbi:MAG: arginine decarboxylase, pyruvoyl-dependent [Methanobacterium sp.]|nr:arginine decarboxylase, pyruvoyl-dependent [Methanobacterium sp.]